MKSEIIEKVIKALWHPHLQSIQRGVPVYFNYTEDQLDYLFSEFQIPFTNSAELINEIARDYFIVQGNEAQFFNSLFRPLVENLSPVIVVVCQQVLVVENMMKTNKYTADAYFPHLRIAMSPKLKEISGRPFDYEDIVRIWSQLSREILLLGGKRSCITFSFEKTSGKEQSRKFPLSQALLVKEDIVRIIEELGRKNVMLMSKDSLIQSILKNKNVLGTKRGRHIITLSWLQYRIADQVKGFASSDEVFSLVKDEVTKSSIDAKQYVLRLYEEQIDWFSRDVVINAFDKNTTELVDTKENNNRIIKEIVRDSGLFLKRSKNNDCWTHLEEKHQIQAGDQLIIIFKTQQLAPLEMLISRYFLLNGPIEIKKFQRQDFIEYALITFKEVLTLSISLINGKLFEGSVKAKEKIELHGGICLDDSKNVYHFRFLPTHFILNNQKIEMSGKIRLNSTVETTYEYFKEQILSLNIEQKYQLDFENPKVSISFYITGDSVSYKRIGFDIRDSSYLPMGSVLNEVEFPLYNFSFSKEAFFKIMRPYEVHKLMSSENALEIKSFYKYLNY